MQFGSLGEKRIKTMQYRPNIKYDDNPKSILFSLKSLEDFAQKMRIELGFDKFIRNIFQQIPSMGV